MREFCQHSRLLAFNLSMNAIFQAFIMLLLLNTVASCSLIGEDGTTAAGSNDYRDAENLARMQLPDNISSETIEDSYPVPALSADADDNFVDPDNLPLPTAISTQSDQLVLLQSLQDDYWVLIKSSPSQVWSRLKQFIISQSQTIDQESASSGFILASDAQGLQYFYRISQGFQTKSAELRLRVTSAAEQSLWPAQSSDKQAELDLLESIAIDLAATVQQTSYSYAALGISEQKKMLTIQNQQGYKSLLLSASFARVQAALQQALVASDFEIINAEDTQSIVVRYLPQLSDDQQPGFVKRMFGAEPAAFDQSVEYAGAYYRLVIRSENSARQHLSIETAYAMVDDKPVLSQSYSAQVINLPRDKAESHKRELNNLLLQIKRNIY